MAIDLTLNRNHSLAFKLSFFTSIMSQRGGKDASSPMKSGTAGAGKRKADDRDERDDKRRPSPGKSTSYMSSPQLSAWLLTYTIAGPQLLP